jgi:phage terminase large subunit GpA-like protein
VTAIADQLWTRGERRAWRWPGKLTPSEWSEANRMLPASVTSEPGPWRNERTPYLTGIMDAWVEPGVEEIVVIKAAQVGFSEAVRNIVGYCIDYDPGPALVVMPDSQSAGDLVDERFRPLLEATPAVARHMTARAWDVKRTALKLDTMSVYLGSANSSQSLKSRPIRFLFLEEPDEYPPMSGGGGDPISKAIKRLTTYAAKGRSRAMLGGTPTSRMGNTWRWWESCGHQRYFWVPCPSCNAAQILYWKNVHYLPRESAEDRQHHAARVMEAGVEGAWYECDRCKDRIIETQKAAMLVRGHWAGADGQRKAARRVGFKLPAMYSPWVSLAKMASEWIAAQSGA